MLALGRSPVSVGGRLASLFAAIVPRCLQSDAACPNGNNLFPLHCGTTLDCSGSHRTVHSERATANEHRGGGNDYRAGRWPSGPANGRPVENYYRPPPERCGSAGAGEQQQRQP